MIIKQKIIQYLKLKLITFRWILLLMLAVVLAYTQNSLADDAQEDSLEDEAQYEILEANQLEQAIQQETGHRLSDNTDLTKIKHGMLTKSGDSHYIWYATKDGQEHILRVDKNIQQNKQSPPIVKKVQSSDMSDLDHFVLQKKVELGLKNKNHSTNTKINESWQSRILNDITTYTNQGVSWGDWWNNISSGTLPPNEVRKEYNSRMTQTSNHLQQHIDAIGGLENLKPETARMYQNIRREIGKVLKSASSETEQKSIYKRNELKYGDKYGPTYKYLKDTKGYSHQEIAVKSIGTEGIMFGVVPLANNKNEPSVKKLFTLLDTFKSTQKPTTPAPKSTTVPTLDPTAAPTLESTAAPTLEPTAAPTLESTAEPTLEPTAEPTPELTAAPTLEPTTESILEPTTESESTYRLTPKPTLKLPSKSTRTQKKLHMYQVGKDNKKLVEVSEGE